MPTLLSARPIGCLAAVLSIAAASASGAATSIGQATRIAPQVSGGTGGQTVSMKTGDGVVQDELIETAAAGTAQLRFVDATDLSIGPSSSVKLDRFVFDSGSTAKSFVLNASKGTFRFATGTSNHDAYQILTPAAVIGVRGTRFSFTVNGGRLTLTVTEGRVIVCPRNLGSSSCFIVSPGQTVGAQSGRPVVVISGSSGPTPPAPPTRRAAPKPSTPPPGPPRGRRVQRTPDYGPADYGPPDYGPPDDGPPGPPIYHPRPFPHHPPIYIPSPHGRPPWLWPRGGYHPPGGYETPRGRYGGSRWPRRFPGLDWLR